MKKIRRAVLVDDDEVTCYIHKYLIEYLSIADEIKVIPSAIEALEYIAENYVDASTQEQEVDLFLLELNLPIMNGFEFLDALRKLTHISRKRFVIVMVTSSANPKDKQKAALYQDVLHAYLIKPLQPKVLYKLITDLT
ncbi:response regulator [Cesiribacter sp. SM1]|uniref:response regulator n=1 Tax=Cesiribacter sp. SM1 TaxID=2861196 RepID=UPI001CD1B86F|nr:response regulator [Cesiribacter sp. SM1]